MSLETEKATAIHNLHAASDAVRQLIGQFELLHPELKLQEGKSLDPAVLELRNQQYALLALQKELENYAKELERQTGQTPPELEEAYSRIALQAKAFADSLVQPGKLITAMTGDYAHIVPAGQKEPAAIVAWKASGNPKRIERIKTALQQARELVKTGKSVIPINLQFEDVPLSTALPRILRTRRSYHTEGAVDERDRELKKKGSNALRFIQALAEKIAQEAMTAEVLREAGSESFRTNVFAQYGNKTKGFKTPHLLLSDEINNMLIGTKNVHDYVHVLKKILISPEVLGLDPVPYHEALRKKILGKQTVSLEELLDTLPASHVLILKAVFQLIKEVEKHSQANHMSYENIMTSFGDTLLRFAGLQKPQTNALVSMGSQNLPETVGAGLGEVAEMGSLVQWMRAQVQDEGMEIIFDEALDKKITERDFSGVAYDTKDQMDVGKVVTNRLHFTFKRDASSAGVPQGSKPLAGTGPKIDPNKT